MRARGGQVKRARGQVKRARGPSKARVCARGPRVQIFLFSDSVQKIPTCPAGPGSSPLPGKTPLCHTTTGADGRFSFRELPCGAFSLVPQYKGEATVFEMAPKEMTVAVGHADAATAEPFQGEAMVFEMAPKEMGVAVGHADAAAAAEPLQPSSSLPPLSLLSSSPLPPLSLLSPSLSLHGRWVCGFSVSGRMEDSAGEGVWREQQRNCNFPVTLVLSPPSLAPSLSPRSAGSLYLDAWRTAQGRVCGFSVSGCVEDSAGEGVWREQQRNCNFPVTLVLSPPSLAPSLSPRSAGSLYLDAWRTVRGFSVSGRVEDSAGEGVEGATVLLNGQPRAVTDAQGQYSLHQITSGQYALSATKPRYAFTPLPALSIVPSASLLPPLRASHYELCVATLLDDGSAFQAGGRQVALTGRGGEEVAPQAKKTDADGRVCFMVPPGTYQLAPHVLPAEAAAGLAFAPALATVTVTSKPVTGVSFNQSHLSVSGRVICIDGCDRSVRVSLASIGPLTGSADSAAAAAAAAGAASRSVFLKEKDGSFLFEKVVPGKYRIEASKQVIQGSDMAGDEWCWKTQSADVAVSDSSVVGVALEQSGWRVEIDAAMEDTVSMVHGETALPAVKLKKGLQHVCVAASGSYSLRFPDSCVMYGEEGVYYHTQEVKVIRLRPSAYRVSGLVRVNASLFPSAASVAPHASARLFSPTNGSLLSHTPLSLVSAPNATHPVAVYAQEHWVAGGGELLLGWYHDGGVGDDGSTLDDVADALKSAHISTLEREEPPPKADASPVFPPPRRLLFYPRSLKVQVAPLQCPPPLPTVDARPGLYLTGWVFPPLPRVNVSVVADADSANAGWQKGQMVMWAETVGRVRGVEGEGSAEGSAEGSGERRQHGGVEGEMFVVGPLNDDATYHVELQKSVEGEMFVVGPLNDDATYHVELQKTGYVFKALGDNSFEAQKLASITVKIAMSAEISTANEPLPSVLLSLTGDASFRRNEATSPGQNVFAFEGLFPGSYYLRPVLKEYEFSPAARPINLQSGQEVDVAFTAKRVAFRWISGAPQAGVQVEAREVVSGGGGSQSSHYEMAVTNEDGEYRLRGLRPGGSYLVEVAVRAGSAKDSTSLPRFERASPNEALLTITGDVPNVNFVVFNSPPGVTITGAVSGRDTAKWLPNLFVDLFPSVTVPASDNNEGTGTSSSSSSTNGAAAGADGSFEEASTLLVFSSTPIRSIPIPLSRFFEFRDLPRGMYLVKLRLGLPGKSHVFESEGREVDVREAVTAHAGTLRFRAEERRSNEDLAPTPLLPVLLAIAVISVVASLPKLQQLAAGVAATGGTTPGSAAGDSSAAPGAAGGWGASGADSRGKNEAGAQQISFSATCQRRAQRQAVTPTASFPRNPAFRASAAPPSAHPSAFLGQQDSLRLRKASPSAVSPSAPRRRVSPVRAADGDSDVPAFKGFPPMQTRPAWYWRIAAVVPYLLPLCEAWIYSETAQSLFHFLFTYEQLCQPFLMLLGLLPSWFMLAYFFGAYLGVVRNNRWPHFLRFHVVTGMLLEIILQVVGTLNDWIPKSIYWGKIGAHFWLAIAVAFIFIVLECIWCAIRGTYADVPFISDAAYMQIPLLLSLAALCNTFLTLPLISSHDLSLPPCPTSSPVIHFMPSLTFVTDGVLESMEDVEASFPGSLSDIREWLRTRDVFQSNGRHAAVFFLLPSSSTHLQFSSSFLCLLHPPFLSSRSLHLLPPLSPTLSIPASAPFHLTRSSRTADLPFVSEPLGPERAHAVVARANATWQLFVDQNVPAEPWAPPAAVLNGSFLESIWKRKYMGDCAPSSAIPVSQPAHLQQQQQAENAAQKAAAEAVSGALVEEKPANGKWGGKLRGIFRTKSGRLMPSTGAVITSTWGAAVVCCVMYHVREGVVAKQRGKEVCERKERDRKCGGRKLRGWRRGDDKK
ncbi:unnamed protein product [Closterium sp. NIES-65]|nr:unnamed protein product [Closterium sp. NIES-65]